MQFLGIIGCFELKSTVWGGGPGAFSDVMALALIRFNLRPRPPSGRGFPDSETHFQSETQIVFTIFKTFFRDTKRSQTLK